MAEILYDPELMALLDGDHDEITDVDFDADADYNRPAPPIEDGYYYAKVSNAGIRIKDKNGIFPFRTSQWKNESREYHEVAVKAELVSDDPLVNGKTVYTSMPLRTKPDPERNNASGISAAYRAMAGEPIKGAPGAGHAKQFVELLQTEPMACVRVQNVLQDRDEEKARYEAGNTEKVKTVYGQNKIMGLKGGTDAQGKFTGVAEHPETHNRVTARATLVEFKPKSFEPPVKK